MKSLLVSAMILGGICCSTASASQPSGSIAGTITRYTREDAIQAFCAPDVPLIESYVAQLGAAKPPRLDPQIAPFVRAPALQASYTVDRWIGLALQAHFTCQDLAPGNYLVWIEGSVASGERVSYYGGPVVGRPPVENAQGEPQDAISPRNQGNFGQPGFMRTYEMGAPRMVPIRARTVLVHVTDGRVDVQF